MIASHVEHVLMSAHQRLSLQVISILSTLTSAQNAAHALMFVQMRLSACKAFVQHYLIKKKQTAREVRDNLAGCCADMNNQSRKQGALVLSEVECSVYLPCVVMALVCVGHGLSQGIIYGNLGSPTTGNVVVAAQFYVFEQRKAQSDIETQIA